MSVNSPYPQYPQYAPASSSRPLAMRDASSQASPAARARAVEMALASRVVGQTAAVRLALLTFACGGHLLLEAVPGVAKTTLANAFAEVLGLDFKRIQGTPDRLPAEITGMSIYVQSTQRFEFQPGPLFAQVLLFDELNRAPSKVQSALLEAMQEGQVTVDGITHPLPRPFMVIATQNPVELEGTFPPSEAALDRFFARVRMQYPTAEEMVRLLQLWQPPQWQQDEHTAAMSLPPLFTPADMFHLREQVRQVRVDPQIDEYITALVEATRLHPSVDLGLSPRAGLVLRQAAQAWAAFADSAYVVPDHVQAVLGPVAAHRLKLSADAELHELTGEHVLAEVRARVPVPGSYTNRGNARGA